MKILPFLLFLAVAGCAPESPAIEVSDPWTRATAAGQSSAAIYATIANRGPADRLVGVTTATGMAMLHHSDNRDGIARMRMLSELAIPAGETIILAPGATHIMLSGLTAPLKRDTVIAVTLRFATAGEKTVSVPVVAAGSR